MITRIKNFFVGSYSEFKKVVWPSKKQVINHTIIVIVAIFVSMAIIAAIDYGLFYIIQMIIKGR